MAALLSATWDYGFIILTSRTAGIYSRGHKPLSADWTVRCHIRTAGGPDRTEPPCDLHRVRTCVPNGALDLAGFRVR